MKTLQELKRKIKERAKELGFDNTGFSSFATLKEETKLLKKWLQKGFHGEMKYLEKNMDKREDISLLLPNAKSVISLTFNYYPKKKPPEKNNYKISKYAYGEDYHTVIKEKLWEIIRFIKEHYPDTAARPFVDSAPVFDKAWAVKSGLGWIGKNTLLIQPKKGSFFFTGEIITDLDIPADNQEMENHCGSCTRCIDACPTGALEAPYRLNANRCISYLTIEYKGNDFPEELQGKLNDWIFGCDICQDVCPYNIKFAVPTKEKRFDPDPSLMEMDKNKWHGLTKEEFNRMFKKSAVKRTKYEGLIRNIRFVADKSSENRLL